MSIASSLARGTSRFDPDQVVVFVGPTLPHAVVASSLPGATIRGPAARGDVYLAAQQGAAAIALIDGYFEHRLSVWHKEICWALAQGTAVYGAASMGALRAAELAPLGMIGIGTVYERFASGELEDDDEVAVAHEPAERDFLRVSEALVNLRCAFEAAARAGVLDEALRDQVIAIGKALFYPRRSLRAIVEQARERGASEAALTALTRWLAEQPLTTTDQKRADAEGLLARVAHDVRAGVPSQLRSRVEPRASTEFVYTEAFHEFVRELGESQTSARGDERGSSLARGTARFDPARGGEPVRSERAHTPAADAERAKRAVPCASEDWSRAAERVLGLFVAAQQGLEIDAAAVQACSERFRAARRLLTPAATARWLAQQELSLEDFSRLMYEEALLERAAAATKRAIESQLRHARLTRLREPPD